MTGLDESATVIQRAARGWLARFGGLHARQQRELEEQMRQAARLAEEERRAKLKKEREEKLAVKRQALQYLKDELAGIESGCQRYITQQDRKVAALQAKNKAAREELEALRADLERTRLETERGYQMKIAEQATMIAERGVLINKVLKKENLRARKSRAKVQKAHDVESERNESFLSLNNEMKNKLESLEAAVTEHQRLQDAFNAELGGEKKSHGALGTGVDKGQSTYMEQALARRKLQETTALMLTMIQERSKDASILEGTLTPALKAESYMKSVMAALEARFPEPDLMDSDISDSGSEGLW